MLAEYNTDHFNDSSAMALLVLRQTVWSRRSRDFLLPDGCCKTYDSFREMTGGHDSVTFETVHRILNSAARNAGGGNESDPARKWLCDAMDFRELCRIFGERYAAVSGFVLKSELTFRSGVTRENRTENAGNVLSYMRIEITCERVYEDDLTSFFELVRYRGGDNFDLYWDDFPDIDHAFSDGRARGCNVYMRGLAVYDIQSDGVPAGVRFGAILPVVNAFSRIAAVQFDYVVPVRERIVQRPEKSGERCIWVDPEGKVRYSAPGEGLAAWKEYLQSQDEAEMYSLAAAVIASAPGETLVLPAYSMSEGIKTFLEMQRSVFKNTVHL